MTTPSGAAAPAPVNGGFVDIVDSSGTRLATVTTDPDGWWEA